MAKAFITVVPGVQRIFDKAYDELGESKAWGKCRVYISDIVYKDLVRRRKYLDRRAAKLEAQLQEVDDLELADDDAIAWLHETYHFSCKRAAELLWKRRHGKR